MDKKFEKLAEDTMKVTTTLPTPPTPEPITLMYSLDELKNRELSILKSINDFNETQQKDLADVRELISQAEKIGLLTSVEITANAVQAEQQKLDAMPVEKLPENKTMV
jgi:hypothetical protein